MVADSSGPRAKRVCRSRASGLKEQTVASHSVRRKRSVAEQPTGSAQVLHTWFSTTSHRSKWVDALVSYATARTASPGRRRVAEVRERGEWRGYQLSDTVESERADLSALTVVEVLSSRTEGDAWTRKSRVMSPCEHDLGQAGRVMICFACPPR
jgi:hypothetical protein